MTVLVFNSQFSNKMESQKRLNWNSFEIEEMLNLVKEKNLLRLEDDKKNRSMAIYNSISKELELKGVIRSGAQIRTKLKALKTQYTQVRKINSKSGEGRTECEFYDLLHEIFCNRPSVTCLETGVQSNQPSYIPSVTCTQTGEQSNQSDSGEMELEMFSPAPKRKRKALREDTIIKEHQKWMEKEFAKQRQFDRELFQDFKEELNNSIEKIVGKTAHASGSASIYSEEESDVHTGSPSTSTRNDPEDEVSLHDYLITYDPDGF